MNPTSDLRPPTSDLTPAAEQIVKLLRRAKGPHVAITAPQIAEALRLQHWPLGERRVREIIATELPAIAAALRPAILLSQGRLGYWLAATDDEIVARAHLLRSLAQSSRAKHRQFIALVKAAGLGAILANSAKPIAA